MQPKPMEAAIKFKRVVLGLMAIIGMGLVYLLQDQLTPEILFSYKSTPELDFIVKKMLRIALNDTAALLLIHAWFYDSKITRLAFILQLIDTLVLLPIYLSLKLSLEGTAEISAPLLSQLHRLIVNPTLIILLIPAIYFQRITRNRQ